MTSGSPAPSTSENNVAVIDVIRNKANTIVHAISKAIRNRSNPETMAKKVYAKQLRRMYKCPDLQLQLNLHERQALQLSWQIIQPQLDVFSRKWSSNIASINANMADRLNRPDMLHNTTILSELVNTIQFSLANLSALNTKVSLDLRQLGYLLYSTSALHLDCSHTLLALSRPLLTTVDDLGSHLLEPHLARSVIGTWKRLIEFLMVNLVFGYNTARMDSSQAAMQLTRLIVKHRVV